MPLTTSTSTITSSVTTSTSTSSTTTTTTETTTTSTTSTSTTTTTTPLTTSTGGKGNGKGNGNGNASTPHTVNSSPVLQVSAGPARPGENDETAPEPDGSLVNPPTLLPPQQADSSLFGRDRSPLTRAASVGGPETVAA